MEFSIQAIAPGERQSAITHCRNAILRNSGTIRDFKMLSDLSLNLMVEMHAYDGLGLIHELLQLGWRITVEPGIHHLESHGDILLNGTVQVIFPEAGGDIELPPGGMI